MADDELRNGDKNPRPPGRPRTELDPAACARIQAVLALCSAQTPSSLSGRLSNGTLGVLAWQNGLFAGTGPPRLPPSKDHGRLESIKYVRGALRDRLNAREQDLAAGKAIYGLRLHGKPPPAAPDPDHDERWVMTVTEAFCSGHARSLPQGSVDIRSGECWLPDCDERACQTSRWYATRHDAVADADLLRAVWGRHPDEIVTAADFWHWHPSEKMKARELAERTAADPWWLYRRPDASPTAAGAFVRRVASLPGLFAPHRLTFLAGSKPNRGEITLGEARQLSPSVPLRIERLEAGPRATLEIQRTRQAIAVEVDDVAVAERLFSQMRLRGGRDLEKKMKRALARAREFEFRMLSVSEDGGLFRPVAPGALAATSRHRSASRCLRSRF